MPVARIALLCIIGLNVMGHTHYVVRSRFEALDWATEAEDIDGIFNWMRDHANDDSIVATINPPLGYYTPDTKRCRSTKRQLARMEAPRNRSRRLQPPGATAPQKPPYPFKLLYQSPKRGFLIISI